MRKPTLRDVAEAAGVHAATASRALNPETRRLVNAETARRVLGFYRTRLKGPAAPSALAANG